MDNLLIPKLMVSTDERLHLFLKSCVRTDYPNKASIQYLNFQSITFALELNNFSSFLQPTIKQLKRNNDTDQGGSEIKKKSKNQNQINNESRERTVNNEMVEEWKMRSGENCDTVFKDKVKQGPILSMG